MNPLAFCVGFFSPWARLSEVQGSPESLLGDLGQSRSCRTDPPPGVGEGRAKAGAGKDLGEGEAGGGQALWGGEEMSQHRGQSM